MEPNIQLSRPDGTAILLEVRCATEKEFWEFWEVLQKGWNGPGYGRTFSFDGPAGSPFVGIEAK